MAITLADAQVNAQDDVDFAVIDDLRRNSWLLDQIQFDQAVNPAGGGSTLTYGYTRLTTAPSAAFRAINTEYTPGQAVRERVSVDLKPLGGSFNLDRVLRNLGPAATNEEAFQFAQVNKATVTEFQKQLIQADTASNANGFDGLDKILAGSSTEISPTAVNAWDIATIGADQAKINAALDTLDEALASITSSGPVAILGNIKSIARVRGLARRASYYTTLKDDLGRVVEKYGDAVLVDLGDDNNSVTPGHIVPIETRTVGGTSTPNLTDLYVVRFALDGFHGVSTVGPLVQTFRPDWNLPGAVKVGEVEMGPVAPVLKSQLAAAVIRNVKLS